MPCLICGHSSCASWRHSRKDQEAHKRGATVEESTQGSDDLLREAKEKATNSDEVAAGQEKLWRETRVFCRPRLNEWCTFEGKRDPCEFEVCPLVARARKEAK